ncbi:MAG: hypothetical protein V4717_06275 [Bacteroidota bacterium]
MKKLLLLVCFFVACNFSVLAQAVAIGTTTPLPNTLLHVDLGTAYNKGVIITGEYNAAAVIPSTTSFNRMFFFPGKGVFRAGGAFDQWSDVNCGQYSFGANSGTIASGIASAAFGQQTMAAGLQSMSVGYVTQAKKWAAFSAGKSTVADADASFTMGQETIAKSYTELVIGRFNDTLLSTTPQPFLWESDDALFVAGNGTAHASRNNAMVLYKSGNLVLKNATRVTSNPVSPVVPVSGAGTRMMWIPGKSAFRVGSVSGDEWDNDSVGIFSIGAGYNVKATNGYSTALGNSFYAPLFGSSSFSNSVASAFGSSAFAGGTAKGEGSVAIGHSAISKGENAFAAGIFASASGDYSIAGPSSEASGQSSTAFGNGDAAGTSSVAIGSVSFAGSLNTNVIGFRDSATGFYASGIGMGTYAKSYGSMALGMYNDSIASSNNASRVATDPLLMIGNGIAAANRSNAMVVYKNANTDISGYTRLGKITEDAPRIKMKKLTGVTPASGTPNTWTFVPHGVTPAKILSISVIVTDGGYQFLPHSSEAGYLFTVNVDPNNGGTIAVGVKSVALSANVMNKPFKILLTYEE